MLQSRAAFRVRWRGSAIRLPPVRRRNRSSSRAAICSGGRALTRAAASSIASGIPSSRRQIWMTASAFCGVRVKAGCTARARSTNRRTDSVSAADSGGERRRQPAAPWWEPGTGSPRGWPGARGWWPAPAAHRRPGAATRSPPPSRRGGARSRRTGGARDDPRGARPRSGEWERRGCSLTRRVAATVSATRVPSVRPPSSTTHAPSRNWSMDCTASSNASRVLPTPPGPVRVSRTVSASRSARLLELRRPTHEGGQLTRQVVRPVLERAQGGELGRQVGCAGLEEALGVGEVLQPVVSEVPEHGIGERRPAQQVMGGRREEDLAPMAGRADPGRAMHVQAHDHLVRAQRLPGVDPHPGLEPDVLRPRMVPQPSLRGQGRGEGAAGRRERVEQAVTGGVEERTLLRRGRFGHQPAVVAQERSVRVTELRQHPGGARDVGEQEGDGSGLALEVTNRLPLE